MYVCTYLCMYVCMHACMYRCMYVCMYVCMCVHILICITVYTLTFYPSLSLSLSLSISLSLSLSRSLALSLSRSLALSLSLLYTQSKLQQQLAGEDSEAEEGRGPCLCWGSGCHAGRSAAGGQGVVIARDLEYPDPLSTRFMREQRRAINPHLRIKAGSCLRSLSVA